MSGIQALKERMSQYRDHEIDIPAALQKIAGIKEPDKHAAIARLMESLTADLAGVLTQEARTHLIQEFDGLVAAHDAASSITDKKRLQEEAQHKLNELVDHDNANSILLNALNDLEQLSKEKNTGQYLFRHQQIVLELKGLSNLLRNIPGGYEAGRYIPAITDSLEDAAFELPKREEKSGEIKDNKDIPQYDKDLVEKFRKNYNFDAQVDAMRKAIAETRTSVEKGNPNTHTLDALVEEFFQHSAPTLNRKRRATYKALQSEVKQVYQEVQEFKDENDIPQNDKDLIEKFRKNYNFDAQVVAMREAIAKTRTSVEIGNPNTHTLDALVGEFFQHSAPTLNKKRRATYTALQSEVKQVYQEVQDFRVAAILQEDVRLHQNLKNDKDLSIQKVLKHIEELQKKINAGEIDSAKVVAQNNVQKKISAILGDSFSIDNKEMAARLQGIRAEILDKFDLTADQKKQLDRMCTEDLNRNVLRKELNAFGIDIANPIGKVCLLYPDLTTKHTCSVITRTKDFRKFKSQITNLYLKNRSLQVLDAIINKNENADDKEALVKELRKLENALINGLGIAEVDIASIFALAEDENTSAQDLLNAIKALRAGINTYPEVKNLVKTYKEIDTVETPQINALMEYFNNTRMIFLLDELLDCDDRDNLHAILKANTSLDDVTLRELAEQLAAIPAEKDANLELTHKLIRDYRTKIADKVESNDKSPQEQTADALFQLKDILETDEIFSKVYDFYDADQLTPEQLKQLQEVLQSLSHQLSDYDMHANQGTGILTADKLPTPNLDALSHFYEQTIAHVLLDIHSADHPSVRALKVVHWIQTATALYEAGDYPGAIKIVDALGSRSVQSLTNTMQSIPVPWLVAYRELAGNLEKMKVSGALDTLLQESQGKAIIIPINPVQNKLAIDDGASAKKHKQAAMILQSVLASYDGLSQQHAAVYETYVDSIMQECPDSDLTIPAQNDAVKKHLEKRAKEIEPRAEGKDQKKASKQSAKLLQHNVTQEAQRAELDPQTCMKFYLNAIHDIVNNDKAAKIKFQFSSEAITPFEFVATYGSTSDQEDEYALHKVLETLEKAIHFGPGTGWEGELKQKNHEAIVERAQFILDQPWVKKNLKKQSKNPEIQAQLTRLKALIANPPYERPKNNSAFVDDLARRVEAEKRAKAAAEQQAVIDERVRIAREQKAEATQLKSDLDDKRLAERSDLMKMLDKNNIQAISIEDLNNYLQQKLTNAEDLKKYPKTEDFEKAIKIYTDSINKNFTLLWDRLNTITAEEVNKPIENRQLDDIKHLQALVKAYGESELYQRYSNAADQERHRLLINRLEYAVSQIEDYLQQEAEAAASREHDLVIEDTVLPLPGHIVSVEWDKDEQGTGVSTGTHIDDDERATPLASVTTHSVDDKENRHPQHSATPEIVVTTKDGKGKHASSGSVKAATLQRELENVLAHQRQVKGTNITEAKSFGFNELRAKYIDYKFLTEATNTSTRFAYSREEQDESIKTQNEDTLVTQEEAIAIDGMVSYLNQRAQREPAVDPATPIRIGGKNPAMVNTAYALCKSLGLNVEAKPGTELPQEDAPEIAALIEKYKTLDSGEHNYEALNTLRESLTKNDLSPPTLTT